MTDMFVISVFLGNIVPWQRTFSERQSQADIVYDDDDKFPQMIYVFKWKNTVVHGGNAIFSNYKALF